MEVPRHWHFVGLGCVSFLLVSCPLDLMVVSVWWVYPRHGVAWVVKVRTGPLLWAELCDMLHRGSCSGVK